MQSEDILILNESEVRDLVVLDKTAIDIVERAFYSLVTEAVVMPPILSMDFTDANGEVDVKTAYIPGFDAFAIKVSPGFFNNPRLGLPSLNGLMVVLSAKTGLVEAVLLDNGYLTNVRTAAAGAVAARHLAPADIQTAGVIGAGVQARLQLQAAFLERPFNEVLIWSPDADLNNEAAEELSKKLGIEARVASGAEEVVASSQLVVTCTPAREAFLKKDWLHPGMHITCMGSDQAGKNEVEPAALAAADLYVCDRVDQVANVGELRSAREAGLMINITPPELGEVIAGQKSGRGSDQEITICDLTGTGAQDTAIANAALSLAIECSKGTRFSR